VPAFQQLWGSEKLQEKVLLLYFLTVIVRCVACALHILICLVCLRVNSDLLAGER
jgi:hypothetical protein